MKLHRTLLTLALCAALSLGLAPPASAAEVRVRLPGFPVTLCGQTIDPTKEEYPFLVYRDVTYLPLTYFGCRLMGLYAKWTPESGLHVSDAGAQGAYRSTPRVSRNSGALYAQKATGTIVVHNKWIENDREEYPFLLFRNVTYLPMTWANMHDLLGCAYRFDSKNGLVIDRAADGNTSALYLPICRDEEGSFIGSIAAWRGWFWYQDDAGWISRTPMTGGAREKLFELPHNDWNDNPVLASLTVENDGLYLTYHLGGATMGHDELYRFSEDGSCAALLKANGVVGTFDDCWLYANCSLSAAPANLLVSHDKGATWEPFGSENHIYGWSFRGNLKGGWTARRGTVGGVARAGRYAYLLATDVTGWGEMEPDADGNYPELCSGVGRVDCATGETEIIAERAESFRLTGETVWYVTFDGELRYCALDGSNDAAVAFDKLTEMQFDSYTDLTQAVVRHMIADGDRVYVELTAPFHVQGGAGTNPHTEETTCLAMLNADGSGGELLLFNCGAVQTMTAENGWLTMTALDARGTMRLLVLRNGRIVYQNSGPDYLAAGVSGGKLYYVLK